MIQAAPFYLTGSINDMTTLVCAISGIKFKTELMPDLIIPYTAGYFHPVFAADHKQLHRLYSLHCAGKLVATDSYLLLLAFLHSTGSVQWQHPATLNPTDPSTRSLVENNLSQLLAVIAKTDIIIHPRFKQPSFVINYNNADLNNLSGWIETWNDNIEEFYDRRASDKEREELSKLENKLTDLIRSGEPTRGYAHIVADWASVAGEFPAERREEWKRVIRSCYNVNKMFNTPLPLIKEIKDFCEQNITVGSIHFHELYEVLRQGISSHVDYLGGSSLATTYEILPDLNDPETVASLIKTEESIQAIRDKAPTSEPVRTDYEDSIAFLRARLAYRAVKNLADHKEVPEPTPEPSIMFKGEEL